MGLITFNIENNYITCDTTYLISDNTDYKAKAVFDKEWDGNAYITWLFVYEDKTFKQYICSKTDTISIPKINGTPYIYVGCVAGDQRTTNHVALRVIQSVTELADEERPEIDSDAYDELMDILDEHDGRLDALESTVTDKYTKAQTDTLLNGKVDKVTGKGLSTNDYTTTDKSKVDAIPSNPKYTDTVYDDTQVKADIANRYTKSETDTKIAQATPSDYNAVKDKVNHLINVDGTPTDDTVLDFDIDPDYGYLVEKSDLDEVISDLSDLETVVDGKANSTDVYNKSTVDTKLSAKQNTLTDADKQSITKTGLTTGGAWTDADKTSARNRINAAGIYDAIFNETLTENTTVLIIDVGELSEVALSILCPKPTESYKLGNTSITFNNNEQAPVAQYYLSDGQSELYNTYPSQRRKVVCTYKYMSGVSQLSAISSFTTVYSADNTGIGVYQREQVGNVKRVKITTANGLPVGTTVIVSGVKV